MPKFDLSAVIRNVDEEQTPIKEGLNGSELTAQKVIVNALLSMPENDRAEGMERYKRGRLADRIMKNRETNLKSEDIVLIKTLVGKLYGPLIVMRIYDIIDPQGDEGTPKE